jgi:hypothetical protein
MPATASFASIGSTHRNCRRNSVIIVPTSTLPGVPTAQTIAGSIINFTIAGKFRSAAVISAAAIAIGAAFCAAIRERAPRFQAKSVIDVLPSNWLCFVDLQANGKLRFPPARPPPLSSMPSTVSFPGGGEFGWEFFAIERLSH